MRSRREPLKLENYVHEERVERDAARVPCRLVVLVQCRVGDWSALVARRERKMMRLIACEQAELEKRFGLEVTRWVITHSAGGIRQLTLGMQGRWTFETREAAESLLDAEDGLFRREIAKVIGPSWETLEVRSWPCWPEHFDPKTCWGEFELFWWETWLTSWYDQPCLKGGWDESSR